MSDEAFVDAILAAPDDDGPRLVYADALIERGDARGEFIVVQCERARLERAGLKGTRAHHDVAERERQLSLAHVKSWVDPIGLTRWHGQFERGFITHLSITPNGLRTRWEVFARQPLASIRLRMALRQGTMAELAWVAAHATTPETIAIECYDGEAVFDPALLREALAEGADLRDPWPNGEFVDGQISPAIVKLHLSHPSPSDLRDACALPRLTELDCRNMTALGPADVRLPGMPALTRLGASYIRADVATALLRQEPPPKLRELGLTNEYRAPFPESVACAFGESPFLPRLDALNADLALDERLARALGDRAIALKKLGLERFPVDDGALDVMFGSDLAPRLASLWISARDYPRPDAIVRANLARLHTLTLDHFSIDTRIAPEMVRGLPSVNSLDIFAGKLVVGVPEILRARWPSAHISEAP